MFGKLFNNLKSGLTKTRNALTDKINEALTSSRFKPNEYVFDHWVNQTTAVLHLV